MTVKLATTQQIGNRRVFDHANIGTARCDSCHNGVGATGLSNNHVAFNGGTDCASCHTPVGWKVVAFDHAVVSGACFSCHNGTVAISTGLLTAKNAQTHIASDNTCESCHSSFTTWKTAFNHANIGTATCVSCHNGVNATGKLSLSGQHLQTSDTCESCHTTAAWAPVTGLTTPKPDVTTCFTCHNGTDAKGKGASTSCRATLAIAVTRQQLGRLPRWTMDL